MKDRLLPCCPMSNVHFILIFNLFLCVRNSQYCIVLSSAKLEKTNTHLSTVGSSLESHTSFANHTGSKLLSHKQLAIFIKYVHLYIMIKTIMMSPERQQPPLYFCQGQSQARGPSHFRCRNKTILKQQDGDEQE